MDLHSILSIILTKYACIYALEIVKMLIYAITVGSKKERKRQVFFQLLKGNIKLICELA